MNHKMLRHITLSVFPLLLLSACAGSPKYDRYGADGTLTPQSVSAAPQMATGKQVLWGGVIMTTVNLKDRTQIEVLAFPLDSDTRPQIDNVSLGRFILEKDGFLEPANYAQQRLITVVGTVAGTLPGTVGESGYNFPLVNAQQLTLWPRYRGGSGVGSNIHFGIGVGSGGHWGTGVGIGF
jgi:outer membrane lipoprotein